jgi:hypothetical protein
MLSDVMAKRKISMRLDELDLKLLEDVSALEGTIFYGKDRTELVTEAIRKIYLPVMKEKDSEGDGKQ